MRTPLSPEWLEQTVERGSKLPDNSPVTSEDVITLVEEIRYQQVFISRFLDHLTVFSSRINRLIDGQVA